MTILALGYPEFNTAPRNSLSFFDENKKWNIDSEFYPRFYARCPSDLKLFEPFYKYNWIKEVNVVKRRIFWDPLKKYRKFSEIILNDPAKVPGLFANLYSHGIWCFSADLPYKLASMLYQKKKAYNKIKKLKTIIFDIESSMDVPFLICGNEGIFDLETFNFEPKNEHILDGSAVDNVVDFMKLAKKQHLSVAHNATFDWTTIHNYASRARLEKPGPPTMEKVQIFQGAFHGNEFWMPKYLPTFCTLLGIGIAFQRPVSHDLKMIVHSLKVRKGKREIIWNKKQIYDIYKKDRKRVIQYCRDDVEDCKLLFEYMAPTLFIPSIQAGLPVDNLLYSGIKSIWEALLMRKCIEDDILITMFDKKIAGEGRYASPYGRYDAKTKFKSRYGGVKGGYIQSVPEKYWKTILNDVYTIDFTAYYPNLMKCFNISPETVRYMSQKDPDGITIYYDKGEWKVKVLDNPPGIFPSVLGPILDATLELKQKVKVDKRFKPAYKGFKSLRDSAWATIGIRKGQSRFKNDWALGLTTMRAGQGIKYVADRLENKELNNEFDISIKNLQVDTDGVNSLSSKHPENIVRRIEDEIEEMWKYRFQLDIDYHPAFFIFAGAKNYAFLTEDGEFRVKGQLTKRTFPRLAREKIEDVLKAYLTNDNWKKEQKQVLKTYSTSDDPGDFSFSVLIQKHYSDSYYQQLSDRLGSGFKSVYVKKKARFIAQPKESYELMENFDINNVDRKWYKWHFTEYLIKKVCDLNPQKELDVYFK